MDQIYIRRVKKDDLPSIVDISIRAWQSTYRGIIDQDFLDHMNLEEQLQKRLADYKKEEFIVAEIEQEIVGFCRYCDHNGHSPQIPGVDCEIWALYVKPERKRQGIGKALVEFVKREMNEKRKQKMIIWCLKENEPSKQFYRKVGGKEIPDLKFFENGGKRYQETGFIYDI